jgi:predicted short-subunit dehydrogenase-like oxidoreductase (DUF2520 family)
VKVSIIGTGNMATHLGLRFKEQGVNIGQIFGRNALKAEYLSQKLEAKPISNPYDFDPAIDVLIIAVSDSAILSVGETFLRFITQQLVVHTSGSMPSTILQPYFKNYGTLYPLQTFSIGSQPDFEKIPVFYNANNLNNSLLIKQLAEKLSPKTYDISDDDRLVLHVAAVFVNNFTNHLFKIGAEILNQKNLPLDVLMPLIEETVNKVKNNTPSVMQTGPALRGDNVTISKHLDYIEKHIPQYDLIYKILSININKDIKLNKPGKK